MNFIEELGKKKMEVIEFMEGCKTNETQMARILQTQTERGEFEICSTEDMPGDAYIDFVHHTSAYIAGGLIDLYLEGKLDDHQKKILFRSLNYFHEYLNMGHGYNKYIDLLNILEVFIQFDVVKFITSHSDFNIEFTNAFIETVNKVRKDYINKKDKTMWGESYRNQMATVIRKTNVIK